MESLFEQAVEGIVAQGYAVIDGFLTETEVKILRERFIERRRRDEFYAAGIGQGEQHQRDRSIRGDLIHWLDREEAFPAELTFLERMDHLMDYFNRTCFLGVRDCEFHYAVYPPGKYYLRHLDQFQKDDARVMSVICYLNQDWAEADGGELILYLPQNGGQESREAVLPIGGRLVCFESAKLEHEVRSSSRDRYSLTGWLRRASQLPGL